MFVEVLNSLCFHFMYFPYIIIVFCNLKIHNQNRYSVELLITAWYKISNPVYKPYNVRMILHVCLIISLSIKITMWSFYASIHSTVLYNIMYLLLILIITRISTQWVKMTRQKSGSNITGFMINLNMKSCILGYIIKNFKISYMCKIWKVY